MEQKKKSSWKGKIELLVLALVGGTLGFFAVRIVDLSSFSTMPSRIKFFAYILFFALIWLGYLIQVVLHELGHLVGGLLSGYRFSSFRIGRTVLMKKGGKWKIKRFFLAGTGGQCLMIPPESKNGRYPVVLGTLGGALFNLFFGLLFLLLTWLTLGVSIWLTVFLGANAFFGLFFALLNGIPLRLSMVPNDGATVISLKRNPLAAKEFCLHLKINEMSYEGVRIKDMPAEWFSFYGEKQWKNEMLAESAVFSCNRLMDEFRFDEAEENMKALLAANTAVAGIHRKLLACDLVYCELIGACRNEVLVDYLSAEQFRFMKAMKDFPAIIRTDYAYAVLAEADDRKAKMLKATFEKVAKSYPSEGDILSERALIEYVDALAKKRKCTDGD